MPRSAPVPTTTDGHVHISVGLRTLLQPEAATPVVASPTPDLRLVRWSLFAADALLCGLLVVMMWRSQMPLGWFEAGLCLSGVGLGTWLACLALQLGHTAPQTPAQG